MNTIVKCENLKKKFGSKEVLHGISFEIKEGDILAFIGPNGSGKTTTIKSMLGLQSITNGKITINGFDIEKDFEKAIEKVGAIVENPDSYMYLSGRQNLKLIANLYPNITKDKIEEIIKIVGLEHRINDKVKKYSLGMRQRLGIAKALLNNPNVLILDEPTNGLDPEGIKELRLLLKRLAKSGMGILISSHNLSELESFCNKVCIISSGKVIEQSDITDFKKEADKYIFKVNNTKGIKDVKIIDEEKFEFTGTKEDVANMVKKLVENDISIYEVKEIEVSLEEAFLNMTGGNKID